MVYQVLARKWRPKIFADLVGQEHVVQALRNALSQGRLHHAYLLTGTRGVGKTTIARILAKSLNCEYAKQGEPCGSCQNCIQIDAGRYVDVLEIDAASNTGIDNIREVLENAQYVPTAGKYKVYIIDEVHMLSKSAFNAMLKTLEEPPPHVKFILATTDPHKVPVTVLSRCLQFVLRNMTARQIAEHLAHVLTVEHISYEAPALQLLGRSAMGSMRDALSLLDQAVAMGSGSVGEHDVRRMIGAVDKYYLYELLQGIINRNGEALLQTAREMAERAVGFDNALSELAMLLQHLALAKAVPTVLGEDSDRETLLHLLQHLSEEAIQLYYQCAIHGKRDLSLAPDEYAGFVMTLLRMLAFAPIAAHTCDTESMIEGTQLRNPETVNAAGAADMLSASAGTPVVEQELSANLSYHQPAQQSDKHWASTFRGNPTAAVSDITEDLPVAEVCEAEQQSNTLNADVGTTSALTEAAENSNTDALAVDAPLIQQNILDTDVGTAPVLSEAANTPVQVHAKNSHNNDLPDFTPENWAAICKHLASKFGAAQMVAQHAVFTGYYPESGKAVFALSPEAEVVNNKELLNKIQNVLADAYGIKLIVTTEAWNGNMAWETPAVQHERHLLEQRRQAQQLLEADSAARQILRIFNAQWLPETLVLHTKPQ